MKSTHYINSERTTKLMNENEIESIKHEQTEIMSEESLQSSELEQQQDDLIKDTSKRNKILEFFQKGNKFINNASLPHLLMRFIGSYLLAAAYFIFKNSVFAEREDTIRPIYNWKEYREDVSILALVVITALIFIIISILRYKLPRIRFDVYTMIAGFVLFSVSSLWRNESIYLVIVLTILTAIFGYIGFRYERKNAEIKMPFWVACLIVLLFAGFTATIVATTTICQYKSYGTSCFDMGIFIQMYHSMINDLSLVTTCERGKFLSHFAVHCSPIYYLLLPFYYLFPRAQTLLIAQAVIIAIGVIPLMGICKSYRFKNSSIIFWGITYLFCAELINPCYYHFHENAFLPPLLMWLFYSIEKKKPVLMYIFMALVLMVKEDAPIYIVCIGLYLIFQKDKKDIKIHGFIMVVIAGLYFVIVTSLMGKYGEGVMTSRTYGNLMIDHDAGFGEIIKTVLLNPAYFLSQLVKEDTLIFFITVMMPIGFMPFVTKKYSVLWLCLPFVLMNLATGYGYASQTGYQYVFGTSTCLIYATVVNTASLNTEKKKLLPMYTSIATVYMAVSLFSGRVIDKYDSYKNNRERFDNRDAVVEVIPEDASVIADTWYLPTLANRNEIYELGDSLLNEPLGVDVVVINPNSGWERIQEFKDKLIQENYSEYCVLESNFAVYTRQGYTLPEYSD